MEDRTDLKLMVSAQGFPTSTPILDALRPVPKHHRDRLSTGDYFLISSVVILLFTRLPAIRAFVDFFNSQGFFLSVAACLILPVLAVAGAIAVHEAGHWLAGQATGFETVEIRMGIF